MVLVFLIDTVATTQPCSKKKFGSDRIRYLIDNRQFFDRAEICASGEKGGGGGGEGGRVCYRT